MKILITICARGGSKGIPGKNIKQLNNIHLIAYTIQVANIFAEHYNSDIALSTDDREIKEKAEKYGLETDYVRPDFLATDTVGKIDTIKDVLSFYENKNNIQYHVYDMISKNPKPFNARIPDIRVHLYRLASPYLKYVETTPIFNQEEMDYVYQQYMTDGYEGQMIRTFDAFYQNKRTKDLLKRKDFHENEYEIVGYKEGKGSREGCIILRLAMSDGKEFDSVPVGGVEYQRRLWSRRFDILGMQATVKYQNLSSDGVPRFNNTIKIRTKDLEEVNI
jgi:hypothetical protein